MYHIYMLVKAQLKIGFYGKQAYPFISKGDGEYMTVTYLTLPLPVRSPS